MAQNIVSLPITQEDVEAVESLLHELKGRARTMSDQKNVVMLGVYADLIKVVSPEVSRLRARLEREEKAAINRDHRTQRKALRDAQAAGDGS